MQHWQMCNVYGYERAERWYENKLEPVLENDERKILWDFQIQTDYQLEYNQPDLVVLDKENKGMCHEFLMSNKNYSFDTRIIQKENEKVEKYNDLKSEIKKLWKHKTLSL